VRSRLKLVLQLLRRPRWESQYGAGPRIRSAIRKWWVRFLNPHAEIRFGPGVHLAPGFSLWIPHGGSFIVGAGTEFRRGFRAEVVGDARVVIGENCVFSYHSLIQCSSSIEVGDWCAFGQSLGIFDGNHRYRDLEVPLVRQGFDYRPIRIDDGAVAMTKVTITADVGERAVIGANSFVNKPVPAFSVVGGVPAKVLETFGPDERLSVESAARVP
jgi:acetyltransferase-like isoleucine patch superfamily enzyme